jgi:hypothetical protein
MRANRQAKKRDGQKSDRQTKTDVIKRKMQTDKIRQRKADGHKQTDVSRRIWG